MNSVKKIMTAKRAGKSGGFWLVKFAPFRTSWTDIVKAGSFTIRGIRSAQARNNLALMRRGDPVLFYHSQQGLEVVGLLEVAKEAFPDPTAADPKWLTVTFAPVRTLPNPVPLAAIRSNPALAGIGLVTQPRLAVIQLRKNEFLSIIEMGCLGCQSKDRDAEG